MCLWTWILFFLTRSFTIKQGNLEKVTSQSQFTWAASALTDILARSAQRTGWLPQLDSHLMKARDMIEWK